MKPEIDDLVREFIEEQRRADAIGTQKRLADWAIQHDADDKVRHSEMLAEVRNVTSELRGDVRGLSLRVGVLERSDEKLEDKIERSGSWDIEALQAQAHQARESHTWLRRQGLMWFVGGLAAIATMVVNVLVVWAMKGK